MDTESNEKRRTLAILVSNRRGVLMRVVGLFSRRGYNIDSLSVGETENPQVSRITIVVTCSSEIMIQIRRQVEKLYDVIKVTEMTQGKAVERELVLVKLNATEASRSQIVEIGDIFKARILDVTPSTIAFQLTGSEDKIASFISLVTPYGIRELVRTGITAIQRGPSTLSETEFEN